MWYWCNILQFLALMLVMKGISTRHHGDKCKFPRHWKGRWYQNGLQELNIRSRAIDGKGHCEQLQGDYFLLRNKESNCFQCLLIIERHKNILQYRESFCSQQSSLQKLCGQITVEEDMFTLIREPASAIICPLTDAYYFNYGTDHSPRCDTPQSYVKPCVGSEKLQMHFNHCDIQTPLHGTDLDLECLAAWKDGSEMFMYGKLSGPTIMTKEESYRCFKYEYAFNRRWYMTMSLDSTCRSLFTARRGPFMMELHQDTEGWPAPMCAQPNWLLGLAWRDLKGEKILSLSGESRSLLVFERVAGVEGLALTTEYRCVDVLKERDDYWIMLAFVTSGCTSQFKCMKIKLLDSSVMILQFADIETQAEGDQCTSRVEYEETLVILPNTENVISCPYPGLYPPEQSCADDLAIGCQNGTSISYRTSCPGQRSFSIDCKVFWEDGDITHIIGQPSKRRDAPLGCYSFKRHGKHIEWRSDPKCVMVTSRHHFNTPDVLTFSSKPEHCFNFKEKSHENEVIKWSQTIPNQKHSHQNEPGGHTEASSARRNSGDQHQNYYSSLDIAWDGDDEDLVPYTHDRRYTGDVEYSLHRKTISERNHRDNSNVAQQPPNSDYSTSGCGCVTSLITYCIALLVVILMDTSCHN